MGMHRLDLPTPMAYLQYETSPLTNNARPWSSHLMPDRVRRLQPGESVGPMFENGPETSFWIWNGDFVQHARTLRGIRPKDHMHTASVSAVESPSKARTIAYTWILGRNVRMKAFAIADFATRYWHAKSKLCDDSTKSPGIQRHRRFMHRGYRRRSSDIDLHTSALTFGVILLTSGSKATESPNVLRAHSKGGPSFAGA